MEPTRNESSAVWKILEGIGSCLLFAVVALVVTVLFLVAGLIALGFIHEAWPGPFPLYAELLGYALFPLSVLVGLVAASKPPRKRLLTRWRIGVTCLIVVTTALAMRQYVSSYNWAMIQRSTDLRQANDASEISVYEDPAFIHPYWVFSHFKIPRQQVNAFVVANQCEPTDETSPTRHRLDSVPEELKSVPASGNRFYKKGRTRADLPFDMLVDDEGTVLMFLSTPD